MSFLKPKDDPHVKEFYEEQLKNKPRAKSSKKSSASSKKSSSGLGGAKTRKHNKRLKK
jgi:hypothetical protein